MTEPLLQAKVIAEEWRDVAGYVGLYQVSSLGRVKGLKRVVRLDGHPTLECRTIPERILKPKPNRPAGGAYIRHLVLLCKEGKESTFNVARLVAQAFIPNPEGYQCVLHLDDDATNNKVDNLQWGDHHENVRQAMHRKRYHYGDAHHASVMNHQQRTDARRLLANGQSVGTVASFYGVKHQVISDLKNGKIAGFPDMRAKG
jgi:hypothetical protein